MGGKPSQGKMRSITGIYSVLLLPSCTLSSLLRSLCGFLQRERKCHSLWKETTDKQEKTDSLSLCLLLSVLATPPQSVIMLTLSCCPAYAYKSPSGDHTQETTMTVTPTYVMPMMSVPTLPHPILNTTLRWESCENYCL